MICNNRGEYKLSEFIINATAKKIADFNNITPQPVGGEVVPFFGWEIISLVTVSLLVFFALYKKGNIFLRLLTWLRI